MKLPLRVASLVVLLPLVGVGCGSSSQPATGKGGGPVDAGHVADGSVPPADGAAPTGPVCSVASKGTSGTLLTGTLLLPTGPTAGELLISSTGAIACAAASCATSAGYAAATHIACPSGVISPSLINTHDHTEYATRAPETLPTTRYQHRNDWRTGAEGATALPHVSSTTDGATIAAQELRFVLGGATSVIGSGGVGGLMRNLADYTQPTFMEGLTGATVFFDTFPLGDSSGTLISSGCAYPKIEAAASAFASGAVFAPHVAEGINLFAENEVTCASQASNNLITAKTSVIHGVGTDANDVNVIATAGAKLIWAPRSNISLYGDTAPVTVYKTMGVTIALGTDWLPSGSMNLLRELSCADTLNQKYFNQAFSDQDLFDMVTKNAAVAAGFDAQIGTLAPGLLADVTVFDGSASGGGSGYRAVIGASVEDVHLVMRGGTVLYGDADLVAALSTATTCTPLTLCGLSRTVCVDTPSLTLAQIQAAATSIYPLFFCRGEAPTSEPTCTPYRDTYPNGIAAADRDGDGVPDASDDCPSVFNPPRPLDNADGATLTKQADVDGDGTGDACDTKPLDPSAH
jgi:cytosine/adenosine deaminase-related metal-dependent hydrolase